MSQDAEFQKDQPAIQWCEDEISIRGCTLNLHQIRSAYQELDKLIYNEASRIIGSFPKPPEMSDDEFHEQNKEIKENAFRVTVSIIGFDGQTAYGSTDSIFVSPFLPFPIKTIFFTNVNSYKSRANGKEPPNRFSLWLHFEKPPLFDPSPLLSEPTQNYSKVNIAAEDVGFFRAAQSIINNKLSSTRRWHYFIHEKFSYDIGLWFIALPYALYWITTYMDYFIPSDSDISSFRIGFFIYGMGISLIIYRSLMGYVKWAYPVNVLEENKDRANTHRIIIAAVIISLIGSLAISVANTLTGI